MHDDADGISEAASKKRRGRPPTFSDEYLRAIMPYEYAHRSRRCATETMFMAEGYTVAMHPECGWLREKGGRGSVLAELGRIENEEERLSFAIALCKLPPRNARHAVAILRRWRGVAKPFDLSGLAKAIIRAINAYAREHSDVSLARIRQALWAVELALPPDDSTEAARADPPSA